MRKTTATVLICILFITSLIYVQATDEDVQKGFEIIINGQKTGYASVIRDDKHHLPMRKVLELMEAKVFYRGRDGKILVLTRDGDTITHLIGDKVMTVNGKEKFFEHPSFKINYETYISVDMIAAALCPKRIFYHNRQLNIEKPIANNQYHKAIKDVLDLAQNSNFYPERFKKYKDFHAKYPQYSMEDVLFRVNIGLDSPFYENINTIENPYELQVLVNKYNQLPSGFNQYNLVEMKPEYTLRDGKDYLMAGVAYEKYLEMYHDAKKEGLTMMVVSAYRTENYQRNLYNSRVRRSGQVYADNYSARAGHSEHQTGLAIDIGSTYTSFEHTKEFKWLQQHAHEYGFFMRYPKGKEWITGYAYEPWHYRFVGVEAATIIHNEGITFEEYHAKYKSVNEFK